MQTTTERAEAQSLAAAVEGLATQIATGRRGLASRIEIGLVAAAIGIGARSALDPVLGDHLPFSLFFPAILLAALFGGAPAATLTLVMTTVAGWYMFLPEKMSWSVTDGRVVDVPIFMAVGALTAALGLLLRAALIRLEAHRRRHEVLVVELSERLEKDLATIAALAQSTLRGAGERRAAGEAFVDRVAILRDAHRELGAQDWTSAPLRRIAERSIRHLAREAASRILIEGPAVHLDPDVAVMLSLCFWELADNARRHGALSAPEGKVRLEWTLSASGVVDLAWIETGGPPRGSQTRGFGLDMLERGAARRLPWRSEWLPGLVRWTLRFETEAPQTPLRVRRAA
ncbi:HWE histidine kinase domain-containing protein [Phenylobacterium sp.]|uniref:HWE histidine kinase domain-containing protein n=1 Tax=Phenylobacterium sp. TaxID=1871053 RepID=UPI002DF12060|nr:HWE histidine kinase domain-containing protein [Phenylobacterium sp.]